MVAFVSNKPVRVQLEDRPEEWIEIKPKFGAGDRGHIQGVLLEMGAEYGEGEMGNMSMRLQLGEYYVELLKTAIVNWRLLDEEGNSVKYDRELVAQLDLDDPLVDRVLEVVSERNPTLSETMS